MSAQVETDWTAGTEAVLFERCGACGHIAYFARGFCPSCGSPEIRLEAAKGDGTVYAVTEVVRAPTPELGRHAPYTIILVDMDEGFRMMAHGQPGVRIGERVRMRFVRFADRLVPFFELRS